MRVKQVENKDLDQIPVSFFLERVDQDDLDLEETSSKVKNLKNAEDEENNSQCFVIETILARYNDNDDNND